MVHVAKINPARFEDTLLASSPRLKLGSLFKKPPAVKPFSGSPVGSTPANTPVSPLPPHEDHLPRGILETEEEKRQRWFVGSIDQGTTSSRFLIFNGEGDPVASHQIEFENLYPKSGYVSACLLSCPLSPSVSPPSLLPPSPSPTSVRPAG